MRNTFDPPRHRWLYKSGLFGMPGHRVLSEGNVSPLVARDTTVALIQREDLNGSHSDRDEPETCRVFLSNEALDQQDESFYEGLRNSYYEQKARGQQDEEKIYDELDMQKGICEKDEEDCCSYSENGCDNFEVCSQCSCTSIEKKLSLSGSEVCLSDLEYTEDYNDSKDVQTQTDELVSPSSVKSLTSSGGGGGEDTLEGTKNRIKKLKNINDLLKQIDEQFNTVLKQTQQPSDCSPSPSEETNRHSETEADQEYRDSYYKQSDNEEGTQTASSRSSYVSSCAPSVSKNGHRNSSRVCSSNISSPDALPSPGCIVSPCGLGEKGQIDDLADGYTVFLQRHSTPINNKGKIPSPIEIQSPIGSDSKVKSPSSPRHSSPSRIPVLKSSRTGFNPDKSSQKSSPVDQEPKSGGPQRTLLSSPSRILGKKQTGLNQFSSPWIPQGNGHGKTSPVSSPQSPWGREDTLPVPYRGAKTVPGSIPSSPSKSKTKLDQTGTDRLSRSMSETASKCSNNVPPKVPPRGVLYQRQLTDPTLDGYPIKRNCPTDIHSLSEGYHSDRPDAEESVIVREIPTKPSKLYLKSPSRNSKDVSSPEDIHV